MIGKQVPLLLALGFAKGVGQKTLRDYAQSLKKALTPDLTYEAAIASSQSKRVREISPDQWQQCREKAEAEITKAEQLNISLISSADPEYPVNLRSLPDAPVVLYVQGNYQVLNKRKIVAVIGTREPSKYGKQLDQDFSSTLVKDGFVTVAGLAQGCDTITHQTTVKRGGATVAIMGASLDQPVYPPENKDLAAEIVASGGALVSSFSFGTRLIQPNFAIRDEWQCGFSNGVIAIETKIHGGTRIAMHHAFLEQRPLAVVDYRQSGRFDLLTMPTFQGNLDALSNENAFSLYTRASLRRFEKLMMRNRRQRLTK